MKMTTLALRFIRAFRDLVCVPARGLNRGWAKPW